MRARKGYGLQMRDLTSVGQTSSALAHSVASDLDCRSCCFQCMVGSGIAIPLTGRIDANSLIYEFFDKHRLAAETSIVADENQAQSSHQGVRVL